MTDPYLSPEQRSNRTFAWPFWLGGIAVIIGVLALLKYLFQ